MLLKDKDTQGKGGTVILGCHQETIKSLLTATKGKGKQYMIPQCHVRLHAHNKQVNPESCICLVQCVMLETCK